MRQHESSPQVKPENMKKHVIAFILMILLTVTAFYLVSVDIVPVRWIVPILLVLAIFQVILQLFTFMHLDQKGSAYYILFITLGVLIAVISALGILLL